MKKNMHIYYDEEGDLLEIHMGKFTPGYFRDVDKGIAERIDEKTGKVTGVAILGFRKRTEGNKEIEVKLPVKIELSHEKKKF